MSDGTNAITKTYDLIKWLMPTISKFPKSKRYALGARIENKLLDILELLLIAHYSKEKLETLKKANLQLESFRYLLRLSFDFWYLSSKQYEFASQGTNEIGRLVGGWIKQQAAK